MTVCFFCVCFFSPSDACEDSAGQYFEQSLSAYKNCAGPESPAFLTAQDDFCRYLLVSGQQEVRLPPGNTHKHLSLWWIIQYLRYHLISYFYPPYYLSVVFLFCVPLQRCVEIQKASLPAKTSAFGELSAEVADTLQLLGSVEMTQGKAKQAHRTMTKVITSHPEHTECLTWSQPVNKD